MKKLIAIVFLLIVIKSECQNLDKLNSRGIDTLKCLVQTFYNPNRTDWQLTVLTPRKAWVVLLGNKYQFMPVQFLYPNKKDTLKDIWSPVRDIKVDVSEFTTPYPSYMLFDWKE